MNEGGGCRGEGLVKMRDQLEKGSSFKSEGENGEISEGYGRISQKGGR